MKINNTQRSVKIISEIHPQHYGSMNEIERLITFSKLGGADFVKIQLYNSEKNLGNSERSYLEINKEELIYINNFSKKQGIELFASVFDIEMVDWCEEIGMSNYKIASRSVDDSKLCKKILEKNKNTFLSLGMYDYDKNGFPYENYKNINYFYCVSKYPTNLDELNLPSFLNSKFKGYSDHTIGIYACVYAIAKGARYIEKHFSLNKSMNINTQMAHVCSMDFNDLIELRKFADSFTLINSKF